MELDMQPLDSTFIGGRKEATNGYCYAKTLISFLIETMRMMYMTKQQTI